MNKADILSALDEEISRLRQARDLLAGTTLSGRTGSAPQSAKVVTKRRPGRPKGSNKAVRKSEEASTGHAVSARVTGSGAKRHRMSTAGKARLAPAQQARLSRQSGEGATAPKKRVAHKASSKKGVSVASKSQPSKKPVVKRGKKGQARAGHRPTSRNSNPRVTANGNAGQGAGVSPNAGAAEES